MPAHTSGALRRLSPFLLLAFILAAIGVGRAEAAPFLRAASSASGSATSVAVSTPAGVAAGDVLVAALTARLAPGGKITAPTGWQLVRRDISTKGASLQQALYTHVAGSAEPASSIWRLSSSAGWSVTVLAYAGIDAAAPVASSSGQVTASSSSISAPSVAVPSSGGELVGFFGNNGATATAPPAGMQELTDRAATGSSSATLESAAIGLTGGQSGARTAVSASSNSSSIGQLVAFRAAATQPPPVASDYAVSIAPTSVSASQGAASQAVVVSTSSSGGFDGGLSLSVSGLPAGASASFSPTLVVAGQSSQLTLAAGTSTPAGTYVLVVVASDGSRSRTASLGFTVATPAQAATAGSGVASALPLSSGAAFYVAPSGSDSSTGSSSSPWRTVQKALSTLAPGQIAYVRAGVYAENLQLSRAGTTASPITIRNYPGESAVLRPAASSPSYPLYLAPSAANVRVQGFVIENAVGSSTTNIYIDGADRIEVSDCEIRFSQRQGIFVEPSSTGVQILRNRIHDNGNLTNAQQDHGIYIEGGDHLIAGNVIRDQPHGFGIQIYPQASRVTAVSNTIVGNALGGIVVGSDGGTVAADTLIVNNVLVGNKYGIVTYWGGAVGSGNSARSNLAWNNPSGNFSGSGVAYSANTVADPAFLDFAGRDLRLGAGSPALDRAELDFTPARDLDGTARPAGAGADQGAFER